MLTATDSTAAWLVPRLRRRPRRLLRCLPWLLGFALSGRWARVRTWFTRRLMDAAFLGADPDDLVEELRRFGARFAVDPQVTRASAVERLRWHCERGDEVAIVSAGLGPLLQGWCAQSGIEVRLLASRLAADSAGRLRLADHCFGPRKVERLAECGWTTWDRVYTDSAHDLPLIAAAGEVALVDPSARTLRRAEATDASVTVISWN